MPVEVCVQVEEQVESASLTSHSHLSPPSLYLKYFCSSDISASQIFLLLKYFCSSNISASQIPFLPRCRSRFARLSIRRESRSSRRWSARSTRPARRENQNQVRFVIFSHSQIAHIGFTYLKVLKYTHCQIKST